MPETSPRVLAAARVIFNTAHDYDPADTEVWDGRWSRILMPRPYDRPRGLTVSAYSTKDPVVAAAQMIRLEILASMYEGRPEESTMILNRLEVACLQAGRPEEAAAAHDRALVFAGRCGYAAKERWERSPRWFRLLTRRVRPLVELSWENGRYRRIAAVLDQHLADVGRRARRRVRA